MSNEPVVKLVKIHLCELCLRGEGEECHVPECALFMHRCPDRPIMPELYEVINPDTSIKDEDLCPKCGSPTFIDEKIPASDHPECSTRFRQCDQCEWHSDEESIPGRPCPICDAGRMQHNGKVADGYPVEECDHCNAFVINPVEGRELPLQRVLRALRDAGCDPKFPCHPNSCTETLFVEPMSQLQETKLYDSRTPRTKPKGK